MALRLLSFRIPVLWLKPTVEIVSRDRSSEYAAAIRKGAPQALQVADLWHIGKNLADSISTLLARCRAEIRRGLHRQATPEQEETDLCQKKEDVLLALAASS